jgi:hypothetical protein
MKKTSAQWSRWCNVTIIDPDGWDRKNFTESWNEKITKEEFRRRVYMSTITADIRKPFWKDGFEVYLAEMKEIANEQ